MTASGENGCDIAVSSYVEPRDTREAMDIKQLDADIARLASRQMESRTRIDAIMVDLEGEEA